ncbi:MAG TPA: hypothetical protein VHB98_08615, partial [Chloroflexota bacterium]|nr:hypothetical protein [Chloroflexota bacterium]
ALRAAQENQGQFGAYRAPAPPVAEKPAAAPPSAGGTKPAGLAARDAQQATVGVRPAQPFHKGARDARPRKQKPQAPRPPRERKPRVTMKPFEPSPEQVTAIRQRYVELAQPEFNGIRHQIANELGIPLRAVKDVVKQVRAEQELPSWWDNSGNLPTPEQIDQVRALYLPLLPEPEIGIHKQIAATLKLSNTSVYQAIGAIRAEMALPRYAPRADEHEQNGDQHAEQHEESLVETASGE